MNSEIRNTVILLILALIWGSSFILMKRVLYSGEKEILFSPLALGSMRLVMAGLVMTPLALKNIKKIKRKHILSIAIVGLIGNGIPAFLFAIAETQVSSGIAGVLNSLTPLFVVFLGVIMFKVKLNKVVLSGILVGFAGAAGLVIFKDFNELNFSKQTLIYSSFIVIATACYGLSVNTIHFRLKEVSTLVISSFALCIAAVPSLIILLLSDFRSVVASNPMALSGIGYCFILSAIGTAFALILFNKLVQDSSAVFASMVTYLIPIVAVIWGILDGEKFGLIQIIFGVVILTGVYIVKFGRKNSSE